MTSDLLIRNARVLTMGGAPGPRRGASMCDLGIIERGDVRVSDGRIAQVTASPAHAATASDGEIDAGGRVLMPGFVDCHTHLCWAGSRIDEWERRLGGATYLDIQKTGGGIMSTVRAVRAATESELAFGVAVRASSALNLGSTTIEVKSGYGLSLEHELKMLRAVRRAAAICGATLVPTALLGHAIDADDPRGPDAFVEDTVEHTLPAVSREIGQPGALAVDAFCEQGAWSVGQSVRLLDRARALGHPIRVHADQFSSLGMVFEAIRMGARSVDHLEASSDDDLRAIARSRTTAVLLPCCGFHLDGRYANGRAIIDAGGAVAVATNANPGSAPCWSIPMAIALAVRFCKLTCAEAITAATVNAAAVLGLDDRGYIAPGARADLLLLNDVDERALGFEFGAHPVGMTFSTGRGVVPA